MQEINQELPPERRRLPYGGLPFKGLVVSSLILAIIVATKNPVSGGPRVIILFLSVLFLVLVNIFALLLQTIWMFYSKQDYSWSRLLYCAVTLAIGVVFLIGLQTLNQLRVVDAVLVVAFEVVVQFYIIRRF